jgi:hypothetical protein
VSVNRPTTLLIYTLPHARIHVLLDVTTASIYYLVMRRDANPAQCEFSERATDHSRGGHSLGWMEVHIRFVAGLWVGIGMADAPAMCRG